MEARRAVWPYLVLLLEVAVFFRHILFGPYLIPWDMQFYHQPLAWFVSRSLARGELPLWDPFTYCGMPLYANLTAQVFYPPSLLIYLLSNWIGNGDHLLYLLHVQLVAHVLLGGIGTYWLLERLGAARGAALAAATVYQLGAYFASQTQHLGAINAAAWLPLAWLAVIELAERFSRRWLAALAAVLAMSLLAGFPAAAVVVYGSSLMLAGSLVLARRARWPVIASCGVAVSLSLALSAVQLLPTMELSRHSVASLRSEFMSSGGGVPAAALATMVLPNRFGVFQLDAAAWKLPWDPTFMYLYCGIPALLFAAFALVRRRAPALVFGAITAACGLWMLGGETPVYRTIFLLLPGSVKSALYSEFAMCAFTLGLAVLAGLGAHEWLKGRSRLAHAAVVIVTAADLIAFGSGRPFNTVDARREPGVGHDHFDRFPEIPERVRHLVNQQHPPWRIDTMEASPHWAGCANLFEVPAANGNDPFALLRYMRVRTIFTGGERWGRYYEVRDPDSPVLKFLNVRYLISNGPLATAGQLAKSEELPGNIVWQNPDPMPRFFLVSRVRRAADLDDAVRALQAPGFDPGVEAVVESAVTADPAAAGTVRIIRYSPREVVIETDTAAQSFLVTSEAWYPGWRAQIDGRDHPFVLTNAAFRGMEIPAGRHTVTMRFDPPILSRSALISAAALAIVLWLALRDNGRIGTAWTSSSS